MNRNNDHDDALARWIDDGPNVAPDRFVWAVVERIEHTPQRGAWRVALENLPMIAKLAAPVIAAAAVLVVAILVFVGLGRNDGTGQSPSQTPLPSSQPSATTSTEPCGTSIEAPGTIHVVWCIPRGNDRTVVDFTIDAPTAWADRTFGGVDAFYFRPTGRAIAIGRKGPDTVDEWVAQFTATDAFEVSEPQPITLDGIAGFVLDLRLADGVAATDAPPVLDDSELPFTIREGFTARVWIIDLPGEALAIVTSAPDSEFADWGGQVSAAVDSLRWGP